jgi:hypothetical protein
MLSILYTYEIDRMNYYFISHFDIANYDRDLSTVIFYHYLPILLSTLGCLLVGPQRV